jgi:osmotically inducible lipoprotein OsmB
MHTRQLLLLAATAAVSLALGACTTTQERVSGAGAGALVGSVAGPPGAVVGAVGGAVVGPSVSNATVDRRRRR